MAAGESLAVLDDTEWRTALEKAEKDLEANRSRRADIEWQIQRDEQLLRAELVRAEAEVEAAVAQLEDVRREQRLYSDSLVLSPGRARRPLDELVPVRHAAARLLQHRSAVNLVQARLEAARGREHEIDVLRRIHEKLLQDRALLQHHLSATILRAPARGVVMTGDLAKRVGDRVQAGEAILELAGPEGWETTTAIRDIDLPKVKAGQPARLYVNAFPHLEYGIFSGRVESVSGTPRAEGGYPVRISVSGPHVSARGRRTGRRREILYSMAGDRTESR